jgi:hypothetical protein
MLSKSRSSALDIRSREFLVFLVSLVFGAFSRVMEHRAIFASCKPPIRGYFILKESAMKKRKEKTVEQPAPFTPGITRAMVRQHAFELYRDKLRNHPLTIEDWVLAEKDLVNSLEADNLPK